VNTSSKFLCGAEVPIISRLGPDDPIPTPFLGTPAARSESATVPRETVRTMRHRPPRRPGPRRAVAAVELGVLLPFLTLLFAAGVDYARVFYSATVVANCAANGATYASRSQYDAASPYASVQAAALADATDLSPAPTVTSTTGTDASGTPYAEVTVSYPFKTLVAWFPGSQTTSIVRTVRMDMAPDNPK
jgi:Flp pilus assembly protein TadG